MILQAMWTQDTTVTTDANDAVIDTTYGIRAHRFRLAISPINYNNTGHLVKEKVISATELNLNTDEDNREAQVAEFDLRPHLEDIYNETIVASNTFENYQVSVSLIAYQLNGDVLGEAKFITTNHSVNSSLLSPHSITLSDTPLKPTISKKISGDNKITLTLVVDSASSLTNAGTHRVLVTVQESPHGSNDHAAFEMSQYLLTPRSIEVVSTSSGITSYMVEVVVDGITLAGDNKIDNNKLYEFAVAMARHVSNDDYLYSPMSDTVTAVASNEPPAILTENTHVTTNWTNNGSPAETLSLVDISLGTVDPSFGEVACTMHAEIFDVELSNASQIFWGVAPDSPTDPSYALQDVSGYVWKGMKAGRLDLKAVKDWDGVRNDAGNGYKIEMPIKRSWFSETAPGRTIKLAARISQTTTNPDTGESVTMYGPDMTSFQTAHLVTNDQVTFDSTGPLSNGVTLNSYDATSGDLQLSIAGTTLDTGVTLAVKYEQLRSGENSDLSGNIATNTDDNGDFSGTSQTFTYEELTSVNGSMMIKAVIVDPNGTPYQNYEGTVQQFMAVSSVPLAALKSPSGTMVASIHRTNVGLPPRCECNVSDLSANLNGWTLKSVDLEVFESATPTQIVVSSAALGFRDADGIDESELNGQFDHNTSLSYSNWPGNYDCKYTANFTLDNMSDDERALYQEYYGGTVPQPGIDIREAASSWAGPLTNYYTNPVINNVSITGSGEMRIQGKTNGSTIEADGYQSYGFVAEAGQVNQFELSIASAASAPILTYDGQSRWNFDITVAHTLGPLVLDPDYGGVDVIQGGKVFDGFAVIDPTDAQSVIKISYDAV